MTSVFLANNLFIFEGTFSAQLMNISNQHMVNSNNTFLSKHLRKQSVNLFLFHDADNVATGSKNYLKVSFRKNYKVS